MTSTGDIVDLLYKAARVCDQGEEACTQYIVRLRCIERISYDKIPYSVYRCRQTLHAAGAVCRYLANPVLNSARARRELDTVAAKSFILQDLDYINSVLVDMKPLTARADSSVFITDLCFVQTDVIALKNRIIKTLETPPAQNKPFTASENGLF